MPLFVRVQSSSTPVTAITGVWALTGTSSSSLCGSGKGAKRIFLLRDVLLLVDRVAFTAAGFSLMLMLLELELELCGPAIVLE